MLIEQKEKQLKIIPQEKKNPKTIVIKLLSYEDKSMILRNVHELKGSDIFKKVDFSKQTTDLRKELWKEVKNYVQKVKLSA